MVVGLIFRWRGRMVLDFLRTQQVFLDYISHSFPQFACIMTIHIHDWTSLLR